MLTIRLSRIGKRKQPFYRLIISEKSRDPFGRALEILGSYSPFKKDLIAQKDRIEYWLGKGAQMSPTVNNLLVNKGVIKGELVKVNRPKKEAAKAEAPKPAETAPAEETKSE